MVRRKRRATTTRRRATAKVVTIRSRRKKGLKFEVKASVAREIWGVVYLSFGIFTFLSLSNSFGVVGDFWIMFFKPLLGWGLYGLPYVFIGISLMLVFPSNKKKQSFPLAKGLGVFLLIVAVLSILHLYVPMDSLYLFASEGRYGGYVGFVMNFLFREILNIGTFGAAILFITFFIIGFLLTFEVSIGAFLRFFKPEIKIVRKSVDKANKVKSKIISDKRNEVDDDKGEGDDVFENDEFVSHRPVDDGDVVTIKRPQFNQQNLDIEPVVNKVIEIKEEDVEKKALQSEEEDFPWEPPSLDLLHPAVPDIASDDELLQENAKKIHSKLKQFGLEVDMHEVHVGPTVIQYTLRPSEGIKLSKITSLKNDLALALAAQAIRIEAPIPGKSLVGIEVPNDHRSIVHLRELLESADFRQFDADLTLPLGRDVSGNPILADLASMPHLLIAGATGSGKSVGMNSFLISLIYQNSPNDLKFLMIDPKRVELHAYNGIAHLLTPVITDPEKAAIALRWVVAEMNRRYQLLSEKKFRNIKEFNEAAVEAQALREGKNGEDGEEDILQKMPKIVVVIDELADLMMAASKEVEASICRIAQMARAVGIHLIIATQRPSVDVITGLIKANVPARIAFAVSSSIDSRTIIDGIGAEDLLGQGDMLYLPGGMSKPTRVQGVLVSSKEIEKVTNYVKMMAPPNYIDDVVSSNVAKQKLSGVPDSKFGGDSDDELYEKALAIVLENRKASASLLQRRLKIGYARAARLLDLMEENGVIGPVNGAKSREIYVD